MSDEGLDERLMVDAIKQLTADVARLTAERDRWYQRMHKLELQIETIRKTIGP